MIVLFLAIYLVSNFLSLKYNFHIFQLNYYMPDTQIRWILKNWKKFLILFILNIISIIAILMLDKIGILLAIFLLVVNVIMVVERNVKKKIVFTQRIIRNFITNYIILLVLGIIFRNNNNAMVAIILAINAFIPLYIILINLLNRPIDYLSNKYYVNSAKKILKNMPNLKIIAVTGSYGKTSTKHYLAKILSTKYNVLYTPGNYNTLLGITTTIRNLLKPTHDIFVCEIGIDRVGQMEKIIDLIHPDYCVITAIGSQHLETFKTQENITKSKLKLIDGLKSNGIAFLNLDNSYLKSSKIDKKYIGYGIENNTNNSMKISNIKYTTKGIQFNIIEENETYTFQSKLLGEHNLINLFGAITVAKHLDVPIKEIINSVKYIQSVEHRLNLIPGSEYNLIDDSYNSNPIGSGNALKVLKQMEGMRILITPGMVELGEKQYQYNYEFGVLASQCTDFIILVNKEQTLPIYEGLMNQKYSEEKVQVVDTFELAMQKAKELKSNGKQKYILIENDLPDNY